MPVPLVVLFPPGEPEEIFWALTFPRVASAQKTTAERNRRSVTYAGSARGALLFFSPLLSSKHPNIKNKPKVTSHSLVRLAKFYSPSCGFAQYLQDADH